MIRSVRPWLLAAVLAGLPATAQAGPWLETGDRQVRADVELLKAAGLIRGPVNSWPLPWMQVAEGLEAARGADLPPHVAAAAERLEALSRRALQGSRHEATFRATTNPALVRDFGTTAREDVDATFRTEHDIGRLTVSWGVGFRADQQGNDFHFEPSYAAYALGDWTLYGGYIQHWWGPGQDSALLFSNNTRPIPQIGIKRLATEPIDFPVLEWLGPWRFDIFAGIATEDRNDFDDPAIVGIRLAFEPVNNFEIGLNRALQLCGEGRPCGADTILDSFIGLGDADNTGTFNEPGNQLAGFDLSYTRMFGPVAAKIYTEWEAEDEDNFVIEQFARLGGLTLSGPLGDDGASWKVTGEWSDTLAIQLFGTKRYPGSIYRNFIYSDGFSYRDRVFGHSLGGDSDLWSLGASVTDARNRRYYGSFRHADINKTNQQRDFTPSLNRETINIGTAGVEWPTRYGDINLELRVQDDSVNTPNASDARADVEFGWRTRF